MSPKILVFATNNPHKLEELTKISNQSIQIKSLKDCAFDQEIEETENSLEGNALLKAQTVYKATGHSCFADDTGLFVNVLDGAPGVYSARFAGEKATDKDNVDLLLRQLEGKTDRSAYFKTIISLVTPDKNYLFSGEIHGHISTQPSGTNGFGYDPVFIPKGYDQTFAELPSELKNSISHRAKATAQLIAYLEGLTD